MKHETLIQPDNRALARREPEFECGCSVAGCGLDRERGFAAQVYRASVIAGKVDRILVGLKVVGIDDEKVVMPG